MNDLFQNILKAAENLEGIVKHTPILKNEKWSAKLNANIYFKREDLQVVRSYKIRGAYNKISQICHNKPQKGVVCASAGNHAQGVAMACNLLGIRGTIFMPTTTPAQKIRQVEYFGKTSVEIVLFGDTFDDASKKALEYCEENKSIFVHPFDDFEVISGQGTVGLEILQDLKEKIDFLFVPIGGGGLAAGLCTVFSQLSPETRIVGVEPEGAASMKVSIQNNENTTLKEIDRFVDGAAVKRVGDKNFDICKSILSEIVAVPEGKVCSTILELYNEEAIVVEPAGALSISALELFPKNKLVGKNIVCIVSGSNNDILRTEEIKEKSLFYEGLKHYFLIEFPQRPGALKDFVTFGLGEKDDITFFQFNKKHNKESGPAIVGVELHEKNDLIAFKERLDKLNFNFTHLNNNPLLYAQLIG